MFRSLTGRDCLFRVTLVATVCTALLVPCIPLSMSEAAPTQSAERAARPRPGKPEGVWPDLAEIKKESNVTREAAPPIPSTIRSPKSPLQPWNGKRVGDPGTHKETGQAPTRGSDKVVAQAGRKPAKSIRTEAHRTPRAHASRNAAPPAVFDDQFIANFFNWALVRTPNANESTYWKDQLRVGYAQGQTSLKLAAIELGKTLFESAEYAARNRDNHWYVYDLYRTYLMRDPDAPGWAYWESQLPNNGRENVRRAFEESPEFAGMIASIVPNGSATTNAASLISARVDPKNQPGNGMLTRDGSWSVPLLSLPGRAGLDLGLGLSYSSMVWTRNGPYIHFDEDNGFPSPGFRLGFPVVQRRVFDAQTARNSFLFITATGRRVQLRQVGTSNVYEAGDSSYLQLTDNSPNLLVRSTDGTQLSFVEINNEYSCTQIKDRNGNYITVSHNALGRIATITDTLARIITFNYDANANLISITQSWNGQPSHQLVGFNWSTRNMQASFLGAAVVGPKNGTTLSVITQVTLNDTSHFTFDYNNSLQVYLIRKYFGATQRTETTFTFETPGSDVPRLTDSRIWAQNWTGVNGLPSQVITTYSVAGDGACVVTAPDGTIYKEYYGTGWQRGLITLSEVWSGGVRQKWTTTAWTQDNTSVGYEVNPRVTDTNVYDASGNRRRTVIDYAHYAQWGLPYGVREFAADGITEIRQTYTDYNLSPVYLDRRIIGLVSHVHLSNVAQWQTKITYEYDDPGRLHSVPAAATQHDGNYNLSFTARGNVTAVSRWDITDINNASKKLTTYSNYFTTGTLAATVDPSLHQSSIGYADSFSDGVNRNTFAYPTLLNDPDGFSSSVQYNFDIGATTRTQSPAPAGQSQGAIQTLTYNNLGQLERLTTTNNGAYKRFWYGAGFIAAYATVNNVADEAFSVQSTDGLGRVDAVLSSHPGSIGGYRVVRTVYNLMGHVRLQSNPLEVDATWAPTGDDQAGAYYTEQTYDWQGRPLVTTNPDNTTKEASYAGCGCAGGAVVTLTDEGTIDSGVATRRQQRIYSDVLGRTVKTEILNWQGGSVYSATVNSYNVRDQLERVREYAGPEGSGTFQDTTMTYDGHGRLKTKRVPEQNTGTATVWTYNADDTINTITDARGATTTFGYVGTNRHLVKSVTHTLTGSPTIAYTYTHDALGNRTSMTDGLGSVTYTRDQLSRLTSETRSFTGVGSFTINYAYNIAGQLTSITDPNNNTINYSRDVTGRTSGITGSSFGGVSTYMSSMSYRAWGALKQVNYGNGKTLSSTYNNRLKAATFQIAGVMSKTYEYYADGTLKFSSEALDHRFDRLYRWDHMGRIKEALSGAEARGEAATTNRPYRQLFAYDAIGHLTERTKYRWFLGPDTSWDSYTNNRHDPVGQLWQYDANGNTVSMPGTGYTYDASGHITQMTSGTPSTATLSWDGDGNKVKSVEVVWNPETETDITTTSYFIHSTVLGRPLTEFVYSDDPDVTVPNFFTRTLVYADSGGSIAYQIGYGGGSGEVWFEYRDPSNASYRAITNVGAPSVQQELDPTGANQGATDPATQSIPDEGLLAQHPNTFNPSTPFAAYSIDGMRVSLDEFVQQVHFQFHGELGLNEAIAHGSANLPHTDWSPPTNSEDDSLLTSSSMWFFQTQTGGKVAHEAVDINDLRAGIKDILKDSKGRCGAFISSLIAGTATEKNTPEFTDILTGFDKVLAQRAFIRGDTILKSYGVYGATVRGYISEGTAQVELPNPWPGNNPTNNKDIAASQRRLELLNVIHELIHLSGKKGYDDLELANTVAAMNGVKPPTYTGMTTKQAILAASTYWNGSMEFACNARKK